MRDPLSVSDKGSRSMLANGTRSPTLEEIGLIRRWIGWPPGAAARVGVTNNPPVLASLQDRDSAADHIRHAVIVFSHQRVAKNCPRNISRNVNFDLRWACMG